ncbi:MAG: peptidase M15 superfamily, partial [Prevotella sp.]|nr:peptidase M15 superfamily [Prevotella sp.]
MMNSIDLSERFTAHFALREFLKSDTAEKHGIPNVPLKCHIMRLRNLAVRCLEPTRQRFNLPLLVTSGFR